MTMLWCGRAPYTRCRVRASHKGPRTVRPLHGKRLEWPDPWTQTVGPFPLGAGDGDWGVTASGRRFLFEVTKMCSHMVVTVAQL